MRRGGRASKKWSRSEKARTGWSLASHPPQCVFKHLRVSDHPVCGASVASRLFIDAAATPPQSFRPERGSDSECVLKGALATTSRRGRSLNLMLRTRRSLNLMPSSNSGRDLLDRGGYPNGGKWLGGTELIDLFLGNEAVPALAIFCCANLLNIRATSESVKLVVS